ncbi:MAG: porin family protein [Epsilonproteobacteria bacterium]|nr:porin family protein [Campylobacterota bacterium]
MKRALLSLLLISLPLVAKEFTKEEIKNMSPEAKMLYMPDIITPEELKSGFYAGMGLAGSWLDIDNPSLSTSDTMLDFTIIAGYNINQYLAAESRALVSVGYDEGIDFKSWGIFLKPKYKLYKDLSVYSLLGYGKTLTKSVNSEDVRSSTTSPQIGIGANYKLPNNFKLFVDYTYFGEDEDGTYKNQPASFSSGAFTTGVTYDF